MSAPMTTPASVLQLPHELIARIGQAADAQTRNACRLAHSHFRDVHENVTNHHLTLTSVEGYEERLQTSLRLKPRMTKLWLDIDGISNGVIDLSALQHIEDVSVEISACSQLVVQGLINKNATVKPRREDTALSPELLQFLLQQSKVSLILQATHMDWLQNGELMQKVEWLTVSTHEVDDASTILDFSPARGIKHVALATVSNGPLVTGVDAITHLVINHVGRTDMALARMRLWLHAAALEGAQLKQVAYNSVPWCMLQTADEDSFVRYLVELVHTSVPNASILLDAATPMAVKFVLTCVPADAKLEFVVSEDDDLYTASRLAQMLLRQHHHRSVPIHLWDSYKPPQVLVQLETAQQLYAAFQRDCYTHLWHLASYLP